MTEHKDKIPAEVKETVEKAVADCKAVAESDDLELVKEKVQALQVGCGRGFGFLVKVDWGSCISDSLPQ